MNANNDFWEANSDSTDEMNRVTMEDMKRKLNAYYEPNIVHRYSSALDILASFIKSQAFIYNESSEYCKYRLNMLMFPCIFLSTICSAFSVFSQNSPQGYLFVSAINAIISFLLAVVNYLKLDAASEAHHISSNHFSRLKTLIEFNSGETLLFEHPLLQNDGIYNEIENWNKTHKQPRESEREEFEEELYRQKHDMEEKLITKIQEKINMIREKVLEIKENNSFTIPKKIIETYPIIYSINIFTFIKMVDDYRIGHINNLKNIINEMKYISSKPQMEPEEKARLQVLYEQKNYFVHELILLSSSYYLVDAMFQQEIKNHIIYKQYYHKFIFNCILECCNCTPRKLPDEYKNPYDCGHFDEKTKQPLLRKILNI
jgi:hypothetical protein